MQHSTGNTIRSSRSKRYKSMHSVLCYNIQYGKYFPSQFSFFKSHSKRGRKNVRNTTQHIHIPQSCAVHWVKGNHTKEKRYRIIVRLNGNFAKCAAIDTTRGCWAQGAARPRDCQHSGRSTKKISNSICLKGNRSTLTFFAQKKVITNFQELWFVKSSGKILFFNSIIFLHSKNVLEEETKWIVRQGMKGWTWKCLCKCSVKSGVSRGRLTCLNFSG
jgi:hypothetical protein